jgi:DNA primase
MRIPEHIVEQIRRQTDIVELISDVVRLRKNGRNYVGLCPFHNEKTPSFNVLPDKGIFKCFGCGKGGDAITFVREQQKISYIEALQQLAARAGVELPEEPDTDESRLQRSRTEEAYNALRFAGNFFYKQLFSDDGAYALEYVRRRGFSQETVRMFALGFSPDSYNATMTELKALGVTDEALSDAGLVKSNEESERVYDRFRGRLMFPIQNSVGRVIGFGGRRMNDEDTQSPKYLNSPQSLVYNKSEVLYGIFQAKDALRRLEYGILVEGYADLLSVYQAGFHNVVASSGTALTKEQLRLLGRFAKRLKIVYDSDAAGVKAALRGLDLAVEEGFDVEIVRLPEGDDPDSIIQRDGAEAFQAKLDRALSLVDFKGEVFREQGLLASPTGKTEAVHSMMETIARVPDRIKRDFMIQSVATRFALREEDLYAVLTPLLRRQQFREADDRQRETARAEKQMETGYNGGEPSARQGRGLEMVPEANGQRANADNAQRQTELLPEEIELLRIALDTEGACGYMKERLNVNEELFVSQQGKALFTMICEAAQHGTPLQYLLQEQPETENAANETAALLSVAIGLVVRRETPSENWRNFNVTLEDHTVRILRDSAHTLRLRHLDVELQSLHDALRLSENSDVPLEVLQRLQNVSAERRLLVESLGTA